MKSCANCRHGKPDTWGSIECRYPVPAWLLASVRAMENARAQLLGDGLQANEVNAERPYTDCPTWEAV